MVFGFWVLFCGFWFSVAIHLNLPFFFFFLLLGIFGCLSFDDWRILMIFFDWLVSLVD